MRNLKRVWALFLSLAPDANWLSGRRFSGNASQNTFASWVDGLDLLSAMDGEFEVSISIAA